MALQYIIRCFISIIEPFVNIVDQYKQIWTTFFSISCEMSWKMCVIIPCGHIWRIRRMQCRCRCSWERMRMTEREWENETETHGDESNALRFVNAFCDDGTYKAKAMWVSSGFGVVSAQYQWQFIENMTNESNSNQFAAVFERNCTDTRRSLTVFTFSQKEFCTTPIEKVLHQTTSWDEHVHVRKKKLRFNIQINSEIKSKNRL